MKLKLFFFIEDLGKTIAESQKQSFITGQHIRSNSVKSSSLQSCLQCASPPSKVTIIAAEVRLLKLAAQQSVLLGKERLCCTP